MIARSLKGFPKCTKISPSFSDTRRCSRCLTVVRLFKVVFACLGKAAQAASGSSPCSTCMLRLQSGRTCEQETRILICAADKEVFAGYWGFRLFFAFATITGLRSRSRPRFRPSCTSTSARAPHRAVCGDVSQPMGSHRRARVTLPIAISLDVKRASAAGAPVRECRSIIKLTGGRVPC